MRKATIRGVIRAHTLRRLWAPLAAIGIPELRPYGVAVADGVTMFAVAGVLLVLRRTGSAPLAGATAAAAMVPAAVSGPILGAWLDVARSRRLLMVIDQLSSAVCLLALVALAGHAPNWTLPAVAVLYSVTRQPPRAEEGRHGSRARA